MSEASSVGIIGGADGPTAIFVTSSAGPEWFFLGLLIGLNILAFWKRKKRIYAYAAAVFDILALDAWSKLWTIANFSAPIGTSKVTPDAPKEFIRGIVSLTRVHNDGAAWSSFAGARWFLIIATSIGMAAIVYLLVRVVRHPLGVWSLLAVLGGGLGNLWNRVAFGFVVDMFDLDFMNYPVFNVADIFVVCGAIAAAIYYWALYEKYDAKNWEKKDGNEDADAK
ncbi:MAG: signal peptidase II [Oscillospiraceae bacterium]|nr:signal peptidase II [Oscillospiraceae bacterium]